MSMKRKNEQVDHYTSDHGDGEDWLRGPKIRKGRYGSMFMATLKNPKSSNRLQPIMVVKSADYSDSTSLQLEKIVYNSLDEGGECPYIVQCLSENHTCNDNGRMFYNLLFEYASGGDLLSLIKKSNGHGLPEPEVKRHTRSILHGLKHVHGCGYIHRDLKPSNILLVQTTPSGTKFMAAIGDFRLAKRVGSIRRELLGTPRYWSPEAVVKSEQEQPSDIWALGCVVLEMLTGKPAWESKDVELLRCLIGKVKSMPHIPKGISKEAKSFLKRCFVRSVKSRWTAENLLDHPFVSGEEAAVVHSSEEEEKELKHCGSNYTDDYQSSSDCCSMFIRKELEFHSVQESLV